jgi:MFS family permease
MPNFRFTTLFMSTASGTYRNSVIDDTRAWWPYAAKGARQLAYGAATVAIPVWLLHHGFSALWVGALVALALLSGAAQSWLTGWLGRFFSTRAIAVASAAVMGAGALLVLTGNALLLPVAAIVGGMNIGGQEVGPFTALEQVAIQGINVRAHRFAWYNAIGTAGMAIGTAEGGAISIGSWTVQYIAVAAVLCILYAFGLPGTRSRQESRVTRSSPRSFGVIERLTALFAVDAFAGGFIAQGFIVYWLTWRYQPNIHVLGVVMAATNVLATASLFVAAWLGSRIGLLKTMVFTHLPSNLLLALIPLASTFEVAAALLLARSALSQMDVPTRQALVLSAVANSDRVRAVGVTNAVRPAAAALSPTLSGLAVQTAVAGAPFFIAGAIKACYDLALYFAFRGIEERPGPPQPR